MTVRRTPAGGKVVSTPSSLPGEERSANPTRVAPPQPRTSRSDRIKPGRPGRALADGRLAGRLAELYDQFGESGTFTEARLEQLFLEATTDRPFKLVAFLSAEVPDVPEGPVERMLKTLRDVLAYMDEDADLWRKRYSWEIAAAGQWQHYIDNLGAFFEFLDNHGKPRHGDGATARNRAFVILAASNAKSPQS